jgi:hypothetical protein
LTNGATAFDATVHEEVARILENARSYDLTTPDAMERADLVFCGSASYSTPCSRSPADVQTSMSVEEMDARMRVVEWARTLGDACVITIDFCQGATLPSKQGFLATISVSAFRKCDGADIPRYVPRRKRVDFQDTPSESTCRHVPMTSPS